MRHSRAHSTSSTRYQQRSGTLKPAIWSKKLCYSHAIPMMLFPWCYSHDAIPMMLFPCYSSHDAIPMMLFPWCYSHAILPMMLFPWCYSHDAIRMLFPCLSYAIPMLFPCYSHAIPMLFLCYSYTIPMLFHPHRKLPTANFEAFHFISGFHDWIIHWINSNIWNFGNIKLDISAVLQNPSRPPPASIAASKIRPHDPTRFTRNMAGNWQKLQI